MRSLLTKILAAALLLVFLFSGWNLYRIYRGYAAAERQYQQLEQYVSPPTAAPEPTAPTVSEPSEPEPPPYPQVDFESLRAINPDVVGWLTIDGTRIHYPVVQGSDNAFYLNHGFEGQANSSGCLFLDVDNDGTFQEANQIVYGHYMKNGSMFHDLASYKEQAFFDAHPTGWLLTPETAYRLEFFSGYVSDVYGDAWETEFAEQAFPAWLQVCRDNSRFRSDVIPETNSRVLTLSTCSYEFQNARFVLHAVLQDCTSHN